VATFNERVYALVRRIPRGKVATYGWIAAALDNPRGAREVGWALNQLPAGSDVPWHRVVNRERQISGRSDSHFAIRQRALLESEGIYFEGDTIRHTHLITRVEELLDAPPY
jgi:methylated-DNA-protein-cysteine methyltransferase-like protein